MSKVVPSEFLVRLLVLFVIIGTAGISRPLHAQGNDPTNPSAAGAVIHVVQRDETLFRIAMQYGSSVDTIAAANGITDPRYLAVGQRLLIPNAQVPAANSATSHMIVPGDSLETLAQTYSTSPARLIAENYITNPCQLYVGQNLTISPEASTAVDTPRFPYVVHSGDTLPRIALAHHMTLIDLWRLNPLMTTVPVFAGQTLWIPGQPTGEPKHLPFPLAEYILSPIPAIQGQTLSVHASTIGPAEMTGTFMGDLVQIVTQDGTEHYALIGVHAFTAEGVYPLNLVAALPDGTRTAFRLNIKVNEAGYGTEVITIENTDLLNTDVTEPEWQRVATVMSGFTAQRYFDGMMGLPSSGAITSQFGTRRSYNSNPVDTFHSGTDFGAPPGSQIVAPAAGVVVLAEPLPVRGNATIIDHGWGVLTGYWHQEQIQVVVGDVVTAGQVIGTVGSTGRSTGPHLHWEMWVSGVQVDPMQWVQHSFP